MMTMRKKPKLTNIHTVAQSRIFNLESMDVEFSNGATRVYERLMSRGNGAVLVIPMIDDETVLMIFEFSGGTERYELGLTKGKIDKGETPVEAAGRELKEEIGIDTWSSCLAPLTFASHSYEDFHLLMPVFICRKWDGIITPQEGQKLAWVEPRKLRDYPMPAADVPLIAVLRDFL